MRQHAQSRAAVLTPMMVGLLALILQLQTALSRNYDCSCEVYSKFVSGVQQGYGFRVLGSKTRTTARRSTTML